MTALEGHERNHGNAVDGQRRQSSIRVQMLTRYAHQGASSRYRFLQYVPRLEAAGLHCSVEPLFSDAYVQNRFNSRSKVLSTLPGSYISRLQSLWRSRYSDIVFLQNEALPYIPFGLERVLLNQSVPYVLDYDDAWFHTYGSHPNRVARRLLRDKIERLMRGASAIIAGSDYLQQYSMQLNSRVFLVPTCVDIAKYPESPPAREAGRPFTVGWIGAPTTAPYLKIAEAALKQFCGKTGSRLVTIGAPDFALDVPNVVRLPWREELEVADLAGIDAGIMPLPDTPHSRGKCAFKLIQYMACWKPAIASPVGQNAKVIDDGVNGFLADTQAEWEMALMRLYHDEGLRTQMGAAGRRLVEREYSLDVCAPLLTAALRTVAAEPAGAKTNV